MTPWSSVSSCISDELKGVSQGVVIRAYHKGRIAVDDSIGKTYEQYDLASLTKLIFTTTTLMSAVGQGRVTVEKSLADIGGLSWFPYQDITLRQLLTHTSGLPWWLPFYDPDEEKQQNQKSREELKNFLGRVIRDETNSRRAVYSDVGFWVLGFVLEQIYQKSLLDVWCETKNDFSLENVDFHVDNNFTESIDCYAPTQIKKNRGGVIQGVVDDDNCWAMGGVSTHAGLFGSIDGVGRWVECVRSRYLNQERVIEGKIDHKIIKEFTRRQLSESIGDWGLGFMKPTVGNSSCGDGFSEESFGHTGFTGTSIWFDPEKDVQVIILSNRVHPLSEPNNFKSLRPKIHNWVMSYLMQDSEK